MKRAQFEQKVLELWIKTRVPLTLVNVRYYTGVSRKDSEAWLDEMVREDTLDMVVGNDGIVRWKVIGAKRPEDGALTFEELEGKGRRGGADGLLADLEGAQRVASSAMAVRDVKKDLTRPREEGERSYLWGMGLSLFLGPGGWLYAGAWREAVPASLIYFFALWLLPRFILFPILGVVAPVSMVISALYVYKFNKTRKRQALLPDRGEEKAKKKLT